jgi:hypothetical protein
VTLVALTAGAFGLAGLRFGRLLARTLAWPVSTVPACCANFIIGFAPVAQVLLRIRSVALERGTKFNRRHFCPDVSWIRTAVTLRDRHTGEQKRRHCHKNSSHGSLDIDMRAPTRARNTVRAKHAHRAQSDVREREGVCRSRPAERRAAAAARRCTSHWKATAESEGGRGRRSKPKHNRPCRGRNAHSCPHRRCPGRCCRRNASGKHGPDHPRRARRGRDPGRLHPGGVRRPCTARPSRRPCPGPGGSR